MKEEEKMNIVKATVVKRVTDDGLCGFADHISFEKVYFVDVSSIQMVKGLNTSKGLEWDRKMIVDVQTGEWLPLELLHLEI